MLTIDLEAIQQEALNAQMRGPYSLRNDTLTDAEGEIILNYGAGRKVNNIAYNLGQDHATQSDTVRQASREWDEAHLAALRALESAKGDAS